MRNLTFIEWIQLAFMFTVILIIIGVCGQLLSPHEWLRALSDSTDYTCYSVLYFDSSSSPYICAICKTSESFPEILRVVPSKPPTFTSNHITDIVALTIVVVGGLVSWVLYGRKILGKYAPWL